MLGSQQQTMNCTEIKHVLLPWVAHKGKNSLPRLKAGRAAAYAPASDPLLGEPPQAGTEHVQG